MKKIKNFLKKKYFLYLICALFSFLVISSTFINKKVAKAATTIIEESFVYVLPQVIVKNATTNDGVSPSMYFGFNDDGTPYVYTMTGSNPANNLRYVRRNFSRDSSNSRHFTYTWNPFILFGGYSDTILSSAFTGSQTADIYVQLLTSTLPIYNEGTVTVTTDGSGLTRINYFMATSETDTQAYNYMSFSFYIVNGTNNTFNYEATFYPTIISINATGDIGLNQAYESGRQVGFQEGKAVGYQNGINDANVFTFSNLISAVIDVPINSFKSLLNFNFLDINLLDFALSIITLFVVIKIVGVINGKT